jgi:hypothetical protein
MLSDGSPYIKSSGSAGGFLFILLASSKASPLGRYFISHAFSLIASFIFYCLGYFPYICHIGHLFITSFGKNRENRRLKADWLDG